MPLYLAQDGKRYRSLGDADITFPVPSQAKTIDEIIAELEVTKTPERSGRAMDHEAEEPSGCAPPVSREGTNMNARVSPGFDLATTALHSTAAPPRPLGFRTLRG